MSSTVCPWSQSQPASSSTQPETSSLSHAHSLLAQMNKMRERAELCDVSLQVGGQVFQVHRVVLAASGPYFSALFNSAMSEAGEGEVHIEGVEPQVFHHLLNFIYTGVVELTVENVQDVLMAGDMLQISGLVAICGEFMRVHMEVGNCVPMFQFLQQIGSTPLLDFTHNYICAHFLQVCELEDFLSLNKAQLLLILHSEELRIEEEYQVFIAAMHWIQHDLTNRKKHLVEVLEPIRFPLLSPQRLTSYIEGVSEFSLRVALQTLLREYTENSKSPKDCKPLPQPNKLRPRKKARKYLYAIGGYTRLQGGRWSDSRALSCVERFDSFSQFWTTVSSLHQARSGVGVAVLEGVVYVVGGEKDSMIFDCTESYDPITKQWSSGASLNYPRCGVGLCSCHGALYALGGWIGSEIGKSMERFDPEENKWEVVENMPLPRYYFGCCELQGFIYVIGGISDEGVELRSAEVYDPIGRRWRALPDMSIRRAYLGVASLNGIIYAVGGWNEELGSLDTVEKYCPQEERWVELAPLTVPRAGLSVAAVGGLLYAVGGRSTGRGFSAPVTVDSVEIYDPNLDTWTEMGNMITSRCDGGVAVL